MLSVIVNIFNLIGGLLNIIFLSSYSVGKVMFTFSHQAVRLLIRLISDIGCSLWTLFEEFQLFWTDLSNSINKFSLSITEGATETAQNIHQGANMFREKVVLYATRELGVSDLITDLGNGVRYLITTTGGALSILSDILWFLLMLVPNLLLALISIVFSMLRFIVSSVLLGCSTITTLCVEIYSLVVSRVKSHPFRTLVEVLVLFLLVTNSILLTNVLRDFGRYIYRKTVSLLRDLGNRPYFTLQSSSSRQEGRRRTNYEPDRSERSMRYAEEIRIAARGPASDRIGTADEKDELDNEATLCVICQERQRCIVLFPCKHLCLCDECSYNLASYQNTCPLCRIYINNQLKIYV